MRSALDGTTSRSKDPKDRQVQGWLEVCRIRAGLGCVCQRSKTWDHHTFLVEEEKVSNSDWISRLIRNILFSWDRFFFFVLWLRRKTRGLGEDFAWPWTNIGWFKSIQLKLTMVPITITLRTTIQQWAARSELHSRANLGITFPTQWNYLYVPINQWKNLYESMDAWDSYCWWAGENIRVLFVEEICDLSPFPFLFFPPIPITLLSRIMHAGRKLGQDCPQGHGPCHQQGGNDCRDPQTQDASAPVQCPKQRRDDRYLRTSWRGTRPGHVSPIW